MHKLLFDQNLSFRILNSIVSQFPNSNHVKHLKLEKEDDLAIWQYAKKNDFHIVSKDVDFNNINTLYGYPPKIIWIHTGNVSTNAIITLFEKKAELIQAFLENTQVGLLELN